MYDDLAPNFVIKFDGKIASDSLANHVQSVEIDMALDLADKIDIKINNPIGERDGVFGTIWAEDPTFDEGVLVEAYFGYGNRLSLMGGWYLTERASDYPENGSPTLHLVGYDYSTRLMNDNEKGRPFKDKKDSQIVQEVITLGKYKLALDIEPTKETVSRIQKQGMSDWEFMKKLAELNGYDLWVDRQAELQGVLGISDVLHFRPRDFPEQDEYYTFEYLKDGDGTLLNFSPERSLSGQSTELEVIWADPKTKRPLITTATAGDSQEEGITLQTRAARGTEDDTGPSVRAKAYGRAVEVVADKPFRNGAEIRNFAKNYFKDRERSYTQGRGRIIGVESLRPGQLHYLKNLGQEFSGKYNFTQTIHRMTSGGGYDLEFSAFKVVE